MRRMLAAIIIICYVLVLPGCTGANSHHIQLSDYGLWEDTTKEILNNNFSNSLPDSSLVDEYGEVYYYNSSQAIFGDENFVIYVILRFPDKATYEEEISDFQARFSDSVLIANNSYYTIQYSAEDYLEYTNDTFFDGLFFDFEIVSANKEEYTISYLNAHVWDYYNDELLVDCLHQLSDKSIE